MAGTSDRGVARTAIAVFLFVAVLLSGAALVSAAQTSSKLDTVNRRLDSIAANGAIGNSSHVTLSEFKIVATPGLARAGLVTITVHNAGSITHEMVVARAPSPAALPTVKVTGDRLAGAVDEEAIAPIDTMGETGDVVAGATVTHTFKLTPGTYVLFCNIDNRSQGVAMNHFVRGMATTFTVV